MKNKNKAKVKISPLYKLYMEMKEVMMTESEAMKQNITPLVWEEIKNKILTKKIINWAIRGEVATGKSTIAMKFMYEANKFLIKRKMYLQEENRKIKVPEKIDYMTHIMSDQTEFLRHANSGTWSVAIVIDEYNRLAEGGINATSEATLYDFYSDVFAQKFNHRFSCAPSIINDRNANIIIDVIGQNPTERITRVKVTYRDTMDRISLLLGIADIYVGDIIHLEWYQRYRKKKFKRMELLDKHGVRDIRELEFAGHVLDTYAELLPLARTGDVDMGVTNATVSRVVRRQKMIYSLIALGEISQRTSGLLNLTKKKYKLLSDLDKANYGTSRTQANPVKAQQLQESIDIVNNALSDLIKEEEEKSKLYREFLSIK